MATKQASSKRYGRFPPAQSLPRPRLPRSIEGAVRGHALRAGISIGVQVVRLTLPMNPIQGSVAAGAIAQATQIANNSATRWSSFAACFQEWAIVGARFRVSVTNASTPSGFYAALLDEQSTAAPTSADLSKAHLNVSSDASESPSDYVLEWKAGDYADLTWTSTSTNRTAVTLKLFASNGATFTAAATSGQILVQGELAFDFRGLL